MLLVAAVAAIPAAAKPIDKRAIHAVRGVGPFVGDRVLNPLSFPANACSLIEVQAATHDIPAPFAARLIWVESRFNPRAVSPKGAQGVAQFMPGTAKLRRLDDPFEPISALNASLHYLSELRRRYGNLGLAAAAYNAGEGRVNDLLANRNSFMPAETEQYVLRITGRPISSWVGAAYEEPRALEPLTTFATACRRLVAKGPRGPAGSSAPPVASAPRQPWGTQVFESFSLSQAVAVFRNLQQRHPGIMGDGPPMIVPVRNYSMGSRLRHAVFLGAPTRADADKKCGEMRRKGIPCIVLRTGT